MSDIFLCQTKYWKKKVELKVQREKERENYPQKWRMTKARNRSLYTEEQSIIVVVIAIS